MRYMALTKAAGLGLQRSGNYGYVQLCFSAFCTSPADGLPSTSSAAVRRGRAISKASQRAKKIHRVSMIKSRHV